jgi:hypothetical protein
MTEVYDLTALINEREESHAEERHVEMERIDRAMQREKWRIHVRDCSGCWPNEPTFCDEGYELRNAVMKADQELLRAYEEHQREMRRLDHENRQTEIKHYAHGATTQFGLNPECSVCRAIAENPLRLMFDDDKIRLANGMVYTSLDEEAARRMGL